MDDCRPTNVSATAPVSEAGGADARRPSRAWGGLCCALLALILLLVPEMAHAAEELVFPDLQLNLAGGTREPDKIALGLEILFLLTVLSLAPAIVLTVTSFTRIIIVFHFVRQALGVQQLPPNQVLASLAIFMTIAIMMPVGKEMNAQALQPYLEEQISLEEAVKRAETPLVVWRFSTQNRAIFSSFT